MTERVWESLRERERERFRASTTFRSISGFALPSMHQRKHTSPMVSSFRLRLARYYWYINILWQLRIPHPLQFEQWTGSARNMFLRSLVFFRPCDAIPSLGNLLYFHWVYKCKWFSGTRGHCVDRIWVKTMHVGGSAIHTGQVAQVPPCLEGPCYILFLRNVWVSKTNKTAETQKQSQGIWVLNST